MAQTKEERRKANAERMCRVRARITRNKVGRYSEIGAFSTHGGGPIMSREAGTTIHDLESYLGRKLYRWEQDLWTIAGWTSSRRYLSFGGLQ